MTHFPVRFLIVTVAGAAILSIARSMERREIVNSRLRPGNQAVIWREEGEGVRYRGGDRVTSRLAMWAQWGYRGGAIDDQEHVARGLNVLTHANGPKLPDHSFN